MAGSAYKCEVLVLGNNASPSRMLCTDWVEPSYAFYAGIEEAKGLHYGAGQPLTACTIQLIIRGSKPPSALAAMCYNKNTYSPDLVFCNAFVAPVVVRGSDIGARP